MKVLAVVVALTFSLPVVAQDTAPSPESTKPSFWQRVGNTARSAGHALGKGASDVVQEIQQPGSTKGEAFRPLTPGADALVGIFPPSQSHEGGTGHLLWPRIALTAEEWGEHLDCWTFRAKIWTSETQSHTERFKICKSSPVRTTNDLGQAAYAEPDRMMFATINGAMAIYTHPTTGSAATEGPNPPDMLFVRRVPENLQQAQVPILGRLLMVTGFVNNIEGANHDGRMWLAGYEPSGNRG